MTLHIYLVHRHFLSSFNVTKQNKHTDLATEFSSKGRPFRRKDANHRSIVDGTTFIARPAAAWKTSLAVFETYIAIFPMWYLQERSRSQKIFQIWTCPEHFGSDPKFFRSSFPNLWATKVLDLGGCRCGGGQARALYHLRVRPQDTVRCQGCSQRPWKFGGVNCRAIKKKFGWILEVYKFFVTTAGTKRHLRFLLFLPAVFCFVFASDWKQAWNGLISGRFFVRCLNVSPILPMVNKAKVVKCSQSCHHRRYFPLISHPISGDPHPVHPNRSTFRYHNRNRSHDLKLPKVR